LKPNRKSISNYEKQTALSELYSVLSQENIITEKRGTYWLGSTGWNRFRTAICNLVSAPNTCCFYMFTFKAKARRLGNKRYIA